MSNPEQSTLPMEPEGTEGVAPEQYLLPTHDEEAAIDEMGRAIAELQSKFEALAVASTNNSIQELVALATTPNVSPFKPRELKLTSLMSKLSPPLSQATPADQNTDATQPSFAADPGASDSSDAKPPTSSIVKEPLARVPNFELPAFTPEDLESWLRRFGRWLRLTGLHSSSDVAKIDWVVLSSKDTKISKLLSDIADDCPTWPAFLEKLKELFPVVETDVDLRMQIAALPVLPDHPTPAAVKQLVLEFKVLHNKFQPGALTDQDLLLQLVSKIPQRLWSELRSTRADRLRADTFAGLVDLLSEKARDNLVEDHIEAQRKYLFSKPGRSLNYLAGGEGTEEEGLYAMERGKGRGKGKGKGPGKGKGKGGPSADVPRKESRFTATIVCWHCGKSGHYRDSCYERIREEQKAARDKRKAASDPNPTPKPSPGAPPKPPKPPVHPGPPPLPPFPTFPTATPAAAVEQDDEQSSRKRKRLHLVEQLQLIQQQLHALKEKNA